MKKPKSKLQAAKERLVGTFVLQASTAYMQGYYELAYCATEERKFTRQLNNLIRLAKEEGRAKK